MTGLLDGLLAFFVAAALNLAVVYNIRSRTLPADGGFLIRVYLWAVLLRYALAVLLNVFVVDSAFAAAFWGDSGSYDTGGYQLSLNWSGEPFRTAYMSTSVSGYGWVYFVGAVYYVFGRNQLMVQLLNGLMGGITVLVIYAIAAKLFDRSSARWAALFMAFFPQMVFWSTGMYKDPPILLCIAVAMYAVVGLRERLSLPMVGMFVVAEVAAHHSALLHRLLRRLRCAGHLRLRTAPRRGSNGLHVRSSRGASLRGAQRGRQAGDPGAAGDLHEPRAAADHARGPGHVGQLGLWPGIRRVDSGGCPRHTPDRSRVPALCALSLGDLGSATGAGGAGDARLVRPHARLRERAQRSGSSDSSARSCR